MNTPEITNAAREAASAEVESNRTMDHPRGFHIQALLSTQAGLLTAHDILIDHIASGNSVDPIGDCVRFLRDKEPCPYVPKADYDVLDKENATQAAKIAELEKDKQELRECATTLREWVNKQPRSAEIMNQTMDFAIKHRLYPDELASPSTPSAVPDDREDDVKHAHVSIREPWQSTDRYHYLNCTLKEAARMHAEDIKSDPENPALRRRQP